MAAVEGVPTPPRSEREVLAAAWAVLRDRLPTSWSITYELDARFGDRGVDAIGWLRAPDGATLVLIVEAKRVLEARDVPAVREVLADATRQRPGSIGLVAARYISRSVRDRLAEAGLSYVDATGNVRVESSSPGVFISDLGADRDPWRGPGRPRGTLKGEPAAKVVRALLDFAGPWKVRQLMEISGASTGSVYRVVAFLEAEALAVRDPEGWINIPDWAALLRRWSQDYQFARTNSVTRWIAPRGLSDFLDTVRKSSVSSYAMTGSVAAAAWASYAPARSAMVYASDPNDAADDWGLRPVDAGANVFLARPAFDVALERTAQALNGLRVAAPIQVAVDLMTGPGRAPSEAEELLDWMQRNEQSWR